MALSVSEDYTERSLLLQAADGSDIAFARLFHAYRDKLYSFVLRISGSREAAEDIVQDVFLKLWHKREELKGIDRFDAYLFRMAHNHVLNILKRSARETLILSEIGRRKTATGHMGDDIQFRETQQVLRRAIENLPPKQQQVLLLSKAQGLKQEEISRQLNISVPTVKSHITQALRTLKKQCKELAPIVKFYVLLILLAR